MKTALLLFLALPALALPASQEPGASAGAVLQDSAESEMEDHMLLMESAKKRLRRTLRDPAKREESLGYLARMQEAALASKQLVPRVAAGLPEAEQPAMVSGYRRDMALLLRALVDLEIAVLEDDAEKAKQLYDDLTEHEEDGHDKYTEDE